MAFSSKLTKLAMLAIFAGVFFVWLVAGTVSKTSGSDQSELLGSTLAFDDRYVGSETCAACHDAQFKSFDGTKHGKLHNLTSWKGKVVGCESCHGPGKDHVEGGGDVSKIISFKRLNAKAASETCLSCHAGKENHNNFRRGEHWRNNVGCTECHTAHGPEPGPFKPGSAAFPGDIALQRPGQATKAMLRSNEPQLCMSCHTETKAQFSKPFRHRVLEGAMTCSDCHNPHGGFEQKQGKLSVGADASCLKCHTDKQGPFVFEHAPVKTEGCASCHTPHGSSNPKMLKRSTIRQLCMECHTNLSGANDKSPQAPHRQNTLRYQTCSTCHSKVHGSNSSSLFFR